MRTRAIKFVSLFAVLAIFVVLALLVIPNLPHPRTKPRPWLGVVSMLRQIDSAKHQYALDRNLPDGGVVSREQLFEYIPEDRWDDRAEYRINPIGISPEASLRRRLSELPARTIIRLRTNRYDIIRPN